MLSKSQAKWFFVIGTAGFSAAFLGLTIDTLRQVPVLSSSHNMTPEVIAGKHIWDRNNCMGCHTLLGEGAYYAPELTKVFERRGPVWMKTFLRDPAAMFPGERQMVQYKFTDAEIDQLVAFFQWIGKIETNGFPAKPDLVVATPAVVVESARLRSAPATFKSLCLSCHSLDGQGATVGPALDGLASRYEEAALDKWLSDPQSVKPGTAMPNLKLSPESRKELTKFLLEKK